MRPTKAASVMASDIKSWQAFLRQPRGGRAAGRMFMTVNEVAKLFGVTTTVVRKMIHDGELAAIKVADTPKGQYRVLISSVAEMVTRHTRDEQAS